jgi:hypothetical protein
MPVAMLVGLAATGIGSPFLYVGALAWLRHIVIGWATADPPQTAVPHEPMASRSSLPVR